ncbi:ELL-associated factor 1 [Fukomys damarensis]|uniref:ELL-associated factor 1 n=1 Tax=Fukomys damarensis TaxID=885580 RepID=A0A091CYS3_FUKDA|nr:ELL-associated factor 1 [Fukomys damarensis]
MASKRRQRRQLLSLLGARHGYVAQRTRVKQPPASVLHHVRLGDNPPEPQLDDIKREARAEVNIIEQMSSSNGSSSLDSESSSGIDDDSSSSGSEDNGPASPPQLSHQQPYNSRPAIADGTSWPQGNDQLMNTLRNDLQLKRHKRNTCLRTERGLKNGQTSTAWRVTEFIGTHMQTKRQPAGYTAPDNTKSPVLVGTGL